MELRQAKHSSVGYGPGVLLFLCLFLPRILHAKETKQGMNSTEDYGLSEPINGHRHSRMFLESGYDFSVVRGRVIAFELALAQHATKSRTSRD